MQELSTAFVQGIKSARSEVVAKGHSAADAETVVSFAVINVLGSERKFLKMTATASDEAKKFIGGGREKTYAVMLTSAGVSEETAGKVVAEAIAHASRVP